MTVVISRATGFLCCNPAESSRENGINVLDDGRSSSRT